MSHAYEYMIGRIIGIRTDGVDGIVAATVRTPAPYQDDNDLLVSMSNGVWQTVRGDQFYPASRINATV
jgi:hypothetical protein